MNDSFLFKIFERDCSVCAEMAHIEISLTERYFIIFPRISFDQVVHYKEVYDYLSQNLAENGEIELPIYLKMDDSGNPKDHLTGYQTLDSLLKLFSS